LISEVTFSASAFSALTLLVGRQEGHPARKKTEWWCAGVCLGQGADLHMVVLNEIQEGRKMVACVCNEVTYR